MHSLLGGAVREMVEELKPVLIVLFSVVGAAAIGYSIYLGFMLAKAEDDGKRQEAKKRIIKTIVGLFIIVILTVVLFTKSFLDALLGP